MDVDLDQCFTLGGEKLSSRQMEVSCVIGEGVCAGDAATTLPLLTGMVKGDVKTIYNTLGVSNRSEVTLEAIRLGLIDVN